MNDLSLAADVKLSLVAGAAANLILRLGACACTIWSLNVGVAIKLAAFA